MKLLFMFGILMPFYCYFAFSATPLDKEKNIDTADTEWINYKKKYEKKYTSLDEDAHKKVYMKNKKMVEEHNKRYDAKQETYKMCLNEFADRLPNEFHRHKLANHRQKRQTGSFQQSYVRKYGYIPDSIDWSEKNNPLNRSAVTNVKHQGICGSCWAFATTGAIEGQILQQTVNNVTLSEQNLVDCSSTNSGCDGGWPSDTYSDINSTIGGLVQSKDYPYEGKKGNCRYKPKDSVVKVLGYTEIKYEDEAELKEAVATVGPIAIALHACNITQPFSSYCGGIYNISNCCNNSGVNHAMLIVGYGRENGIDYWIVKNSYGAGWGEKGYIRIRRGVNTCGIATYANFPIIAYTGNIGGTTGTNLPSGSKSRNAVSVAAESLRNTGFSLALLIATLIHFSLL